MLVRLYRPTVASDHLVATVTSTQQQHGKTDCGLFAIGCVYLVAAELDLSNVEQASLRAHFHKCFQTRNSSSIPSENDWYEKEQMQICGDQAVLCMWTARKL